MIRSFKYISLFFSLLLIVGCSTPVDNTDKETVVVSTQKGEIEVPLNPTKIVTYDYALVDYLMQFEIQPEVIGAALNVAPNYQKEFLVDAQEIGTLKAPDLEKVASLNPDVIFIGGRTIDFYDELSKIAPVVYLTVDNEDLIDSIESNSKVYAEIFDKGEETETVLDELDEFVENLKPVNEKALVLMYNEGQLTNFGPGSRFGFIFDLFGYQPLDTNIEVSDHGVEISYEYIAQHKPDKIFVINRNLIHGGNVDIDTFYTNPLLEPLNLTIVELDPNTIYQVAGGIISIQKTLQEIETSK